MKTSVLMSCLSSGFLLAACGGVASSEGRAELAIRKVDPGNECAEGGGRVSFGVDADEDGVLADREIEGVEVICRGAGPLGGPVGGGRPGHGPGASGGIGPIPGCDGDSGATGGGFSGGTGATGGGGYYGGSGASGG